MGTEAELHEKYFYTQADIKRIGQDVDSYAKMKKVADYDRLMADKHPGDKKLESLAERSEKSAQKYYEGKGIGSFTYWAQEPDGQGGQFYEAKRQGKVPVQGGVESDYEAQLNAVRLAERASKLHGANERYGHLSNTTLREGVDAKGNPAPVDREAGKELRPVDVEKMRTENHREMVLAGVREDAAKRGPAPQEHAHHGR